MLYYLDNYKLIQIRIPVSLVTKRWKILGIAKIREGGLSKIYLERVVPNTMLTLNLGNQVIESNPLIFIFIFQF